MQGEADTLLCFSNSWTTSGNQRIKESLSLKKTIESHCKPNTAEATTKPYLEAWFSDFAV